MLNKVIIIEKAEMCQKLKYEWIHLDRRKKVKRYF